MQEVHFESFVIPAIKKYQVKIEGIEIIYDNPERKAILSIEKDWMDNPVVVLNFQ